MRGNADQDNNEFDPTPMLDRQGGKMRSGTEAHDTEAHEDTLIAAEDPSQLRLG